MSQWFAGGDYYGFQALLELLHDALPRLLARGTPLALDNAATLAALALRRAAAGLLTPRGVGLAHAIALGTLREVASARAAAARARATRQSHNRTTVVQRTHASRLRSTRSGSPSSPSR